MIKHRDNRRAVVMMPTSCEDGRISARLKVGCTNYLVGRASQGRDTLTTNPLRSRLTINNNPTSFMSPAINPSRLTVAERTLSTGVRHVKATNNVSPPQPWLSNGSFTALPPLHRYCDGMRSSSRPRQPIIRAAVPSLVVQSYCFSNHAAGQALSFSLGACRILFS
jgi:hypothetical protein